MSHLSDQKSVATLDKVTKIFGGQGRETHALRGISLKVFSGEMVLLLGPSGSGKTTLLTLMAGLQSPTEGSVSLFGVDMTHYSEQELQRLRATRMGFIFQSFHLLDALTVLDNVLLVMGFAGKNPKRSRPRAIDTLEHLGIKHLAAESTRNLSQGEKQRVATARALVNDAELIIADEPTASLESKQGLGIIRQLHQSVVNEQKCVVIASHDERIVQYADRVIRLSDGGINEENTHAS
jgi:putative ABC transport system ATP-binding protein